MPLNFRKLPFCRTADFPWYETPWVYPRIKFERWASIANGDDGIQNSFTFWQNAGWEIQSPQPPKPKPERGAQFARGHDGIDLPYISAALTVDFDWEQTPSWIYTRKNFAQWAAIAPHEDATERPFQFWRNAGWEIQSVQPPRRRHEKWPLADWDDGNYDRLNVWYNFGWPIQSPQPPHPRPERTGSIARGDEGIEAIKPFGLQTGDFAWAQTPWVYPRIRYERAAAVMPKEDGIERPFSLWFNYGWDVQPPPPPKPKRLFKTEPTDGYWSFVPSALATADYAWHETPLVYPRKSFNRVAALKSKLGFSAYYHFKPWHETPWVYPQKFRRERSGAIARGNDGIEFPFVLGLLTANFPWHETPGVYPRKNYSRGGSALRQKLGFAAYYPFVPWYETKWVEPRKNFAKWAAIAPREDGIQFSFIPTLLTSDRAWYQTPWVYPRKNFTRWGAIADGDDGNQNKFSFWYNVGWEIQPPQPPHPRSERSGAIARGDDGTEGPETVWIANRRFRLVADSLGLSPHAVRASGRGHAERRRHRASILAVVQLRMGRTGGSTAASVDREARRDHAARGRHREHQAIRIADERLSLAR